MRILLSLATSTTTSTASISSHQSVLLDSPSNNEVPSPSPHARLQHDPSCSPATARHDPVDAVVAPSALLRRFLFGSPLDQRSKLLDFLSPPNQCHTPNSTQRSLPSSLLRQRSTVRLVLVRTKHFNRISPSFPAHAPYVGFFGGSFIFLTLQRTHSELALSSSRSAFFEWSTSPARHRRQVLIRAADLLEQRREAFHDAYRRDTTVTQAILDHDINCKSTATEVNLKDSTGRCWSV